MNLYHLILRLILLSVLAACNGGGSSGAGSDDTSSILGNWKVCKNEEAGDDVIHIRSFLTTLIISEETIQEIHTEYTEMNCESGSENGKNIYSHIYNRSGTDYNLILQEAVYTPLTTTDVSWNNINKWCGRNDWSLGASKSILGLKCGDFEVLRAGDNLNLIILRNGNTLKIGETTLTLSKTIDENSSGGAGNGNSDGSNPIISHDGYWVRCDNSDINASIFRSINITGNTIKFNQISHSILNCATESKSLAKGFSAFYVRSGNDYRLTIQSITHTSLSLSDVKLRNTIAWCGRNDWLLGVSKSVSGLICGDSGPDYVGDVDTLYITREGNSLSIGNITYALSNDSDTQDTTIGSSANNLTISDITDKSTQEDTPINGIPLSISSPYTSLNCATSVTKSSSKTSVITSGGIVIGGTAPNCIATLTPVANASGTSIITLTVSDGSSTKSDSFNFTVNAVNDAPTISLIPTVSTAKNTTSDVINFYINDVDSKLTCTTSITKSSSNSALLIASGIVINGSSPSCIIALTPSPDVIGTSYVSLVVSDGSLNTTSTFKFNVTDPPLISNIANQRSQVNAPTPGIPFTITDSDSSLSCTASVVKSSSNNLIVADSGIVISGSAPNCSIIVNPIPFSVGSTIISLTVSDGSSNASMSFIFTTYAPWKSINTTNPPTARSKHTAVWTGTEMIVWGGALDSGRTSTNTGGRFNPSTNTWTALSTDGAPSARYGHAAIWTGTEMIIWGGQQGISLQKSGGRYNPSTNSWSLLSDGGDCPTARKYHSAVWTGAEMIVWGGYDGLSGTGKTDKGAKYNPSTNNWTSMTTTNAPHSRSLHPAVWANNRMIVWGGETYSSDITNSGGLYDPTSNIWSSISITNAPSSRKNHSAVWSGSEMIIWGGEIGSYKLNNGGRYNPLTDSWQNVTITNAPSARTDHKVVWTGSEMIIWGGRVGEEGMSGVMATTNTGSAYNPTTNSWNTLSSVFAPSSRDNHSAIWTGTEMIIWGGRGSDWYDISSGGVYKP